MFLKGLTLKGFKSFADTTSLMFEPGVTVVVGPNGSGKSNVVDAVTWVLGAQGPTTVRSQRMDDVIFAGTTKRPALGRAEVTLTLDNSGGLLPVDFTEVSITRTLYRDGESEYALNGVPCRLLDIQELLSDAGVGRHQHVIVAQGHIDHVLNARPEERRLIIEEAAGILKYRRRKERAERRLAATEANLLRLQDLQREVRRQLRPLERQAEAARRHAELSGQLHAARLHRTGREIAERRGQLIRIGADRTGVAERQRGARQGLAQIDVAITSAEARLASTGDDVGDVLTRVESLRERARGVTAVLAERRRSVERDRSALLAEDLVASLEADSVELREGLAAVETGEAAVTVELEQLDSTDAEVPRPPAELTSRAAEVRGEAGALRDAVEHTAADLDRCCARLRELTATAARLGIDGVASGQLEADAEAARRALERAEAASASARDALHTATADERSLGARVDALRSALDHVHTEAGLRELSDVDGVIGTLLDLVEIADGSEAAIEAAVGDAISAVVTADVAAARGVLARLRAGDRRGAVLVLDGLTQERGGEPPEVVAWTGGPAVGRPVLDLVWSSDSSVARLVRRLVGSAVVIEGGWEQAVDAALADPERVFVTVDGGRLGPSGWRVGAGGGGATAAALVDATAGRAAAEGRLAEARRRVKEAEAGLADARGAASEAARRLDAARRLAAESGPVGERIAELEPRLDRDRRRLAELVDLLPVLETDEAHGRRAAEERAALRADAEARRARLRERGELLERRLTDVERRLEDHRREREGAATRRRRLDSQLGAIDRLAALAAAHLVRLDGQLEGLRDRRRRQSAAARAAAEELEGLRRRRSALDADLETARDAAGRLDVEEAEATLRLETAIDVVRIELDSEPDVAEATPVPDLPEGATVAGWTRELERELRRLGPINALALEEYEQLRERHDFVAAQLDDVRTSRRELNKVIAAIDEEIVRIFAAAFADVSANFEQLFAHLFPGGTGRLRLTEPGDLLNTGVELDARPSGKNVRQLSLLSGGERSLTALAYLFAIFRSRPSPFYVLDEVEAALDDVNLHRFLSLVDEFRREAQLLIVSHQKRTMEAADCLYGVSMQSGGSSKVVSERARDAAA